MISLFGSKKVAQNESHLKNLILMARSDNSIDQSEVEVIIKIGKERGFSEVEIKDFLTSSEKNKLIIPEGDQEKFDQLYDLTLVMMADGIIEEDEMDFVTSFANKLGFRKTSSAFIVTKILEGLEQQLNKTDIFDLTKQFMRKKLS